MLLRIVRWGVPAAIALAELILLASSAGNETSLGLGILLIGIAVIVAGCNALLRLSFASQRDRMREQRARRHYSRHGRWPLGTP